MGRAPDVMEFLRKWDMDTDTQIAVESKYTEVGDYDRTVEWFMVNNKVVWDRWVTPEVRSRLESVLDPAKESR